MRIALVLSIVLTAVAAARLESTSAAYADEKKARTEEVAIPVPRGVKLEGVVHHPAEPNGVAVVIGSGRGYHKDLPLLVRTAEELQTVGFTAIRFDWAYYTAKGKHAPDLSTELEDLDAAIGYARTLPGIERLYLAGKSLGSVAVTMRALKKHDDLDGLILLTLPIHAPGKPGTVFDDMKKLQQIDTRMMIVCGDADPYSDVSALYAYMAGFQQAPKLVLVPGDHGLNGPKKAKARTKENCDLAAHAVALWAARWQQTGE